MFKYVNQTCKMQELRQELFDKVQSQVEFLENN